MRNCVQYNPLSSKQGVAGSSPAGIAIYINLDNHIVKRVEIAKGAMLFCGQDVHAARF